jgi:hypothetical protein
MPIDRRSISDGEELFFGTFGGPRISYVGRMVHLSGSSRVTRYVENPRTAPRDVMRS